MKNYDYGVAILATSLVHNESLQLVKSMVDRNIPLVYRLGGEFIAHVTVFQGRFMSDSCAEKALVAFRKIYETKEVVFRRSVQMSTEIELRKNGNIFWNIIPTEEIIQLHEYVAEHMQLGTNGLLLDQSQEALINAGEAEVARINKFGVAASGVAYHPHITLGRLQNMEDAPCLTDLKPRKSEFGMGPLCFGPINEFGQMSGDTFMVF